AAMPGEDPNGEGISYKRNKLTLAYLDFPLEFRMKTRSGVLASLGFKAGFLINSHTKYRGDDFGDASQEIRLKIADIANVETYRYGVQARVGYKNVSLYGFYSLSRVFKEGEGPALYPVSVGVSLRPF
ncbi:MAG TPA: outer membrane beta-barrel protein, partial [Bacteroidales bacterium]|nr:outer membrane beta-barrel protein [Bacteroidales bacterium]